MKYFVPLFLALLMTLLSCKDDKTNTATIAKETETPKWKNLLDKNLSQWQPFLGIPHKILKLKVMKL